MRPFRDTLAMVRQGALEEDLTKALAEALTAVQATGKAATIKLTLKFKPTKGLALEIDDDISLDVPKPSKPTTFLFPTIEGNLSVQNPMQRPLDLQVVHAAPPAAPISLEPTATTAPVALGG